MLKFLWLYWTYKNHENKCFYSNLNQQYKNVTYPLQEGRYTTQAISQWLPDRYIHALEVLIHNPILHTTDLKNEREKFSNYGNSTESRQKIHIQYFFTHNQHQRIGIRGWIIYTNNGENVTKSEIEPETFPLLEERSATWATSKRLPLIIGRFQVWFLTAITFSHCGFKLFSLLLQFSDIDYGWKNIIIEFSLLILLNFHDLKIFLFHLSSVLYAELIDTHL